MLLIEAYGRTMTLAEHIQEIATPPMDVRDAAASLFSGQVATYMRMEKQWLVRACDELVSCCGGNPCG